MTARLHLEIVLEDLDGVGAGGLDAWATADELVVCGRHGVTRLDVPGFGHVEARLNLARWGRPTDIVRPRVEGFTIPDDRLADAFVAVDADPSPPASTMLGKGEHFAEMTAPGQWEIHRRRRDPVAGRELVAMISTTEPNDGTLIAAVVHALDNRNGDPQ